MALDFRLYPWLFSSYKKHSTTLVMFISTSWIEIIVVWTVWLLCIMVITPTCITESFQACCPWWLSSYQNPLISLVSFCLLRGTLLWVTITAALSISPLWSVYQYRRIHCTNTKKYRYPLTCDYSASPLMSILSQLPQFCFHGKTGEFVRNVKNEKG